VSNDNPYSEAQFKTLKYRPDFPDRFGSLEHGRSFCGDFFRWYNHEHHHVGLGLFTPHDVHFGLAAAKREHRALVLAGTFAKNPERFPNGWPSPRSLPTAAWINPPASARRTSPVKTPWPDQSSAATIVDPGATSKAVTEVEPLASPHLMPEDRCMAAAQ
jgi:transposase InsO family protein